MTLLAYAAASRTRYPPRIPDDYKEANRIGGSALILRLTTVKGNKYDKILHLGYALILTKLQNRLVSATTYKKWGPVHPRAESLPSGRFDLRSEPGFGTTVTAEIALPTNKEDADHAG